MKKREVTLHWDEYEPGDLVRSTDKRSRLEDGVVYEVTVSLGPHTVTISPPSFCGGGVRLEDEEGVSKVTTTEWVRPANRWVEIRIDETRYWDWHILNTILGKEGKVYGVYIYNKFEHTYCCEARPSYLLRHIYDYPSVILPEEVIDEFDHCAGIGSNDHYVHVAGVEAMNANNKCDLGIFGCLGETSEEIEEQVREHVRGNPNWC